MKQILILFLALIFSNGFSQNKIALTIDDLPFVDYHFKTDSFKTAKSIQLLEAAKRLNVPLIGFVNESKIYTEDGKINKNQVAIIAKWLSMGFEIGNHTYSHFDYNNTSFKVFTEDILKGEKNIKPLCKKYGKELKYFRHPFLHRGNSKEKADSLANFLKKHNYTEAPITFDNSEYMFALAYSKSIFTKNDTMKKRIVKEYIEYMSQYVDYYESQSNKLFKRNISHILLVHANALNSENFETLIDALKKKNYQFVTLDEVLKDEAYKTKDEFYKKGGISWIHRWAITQKVPKEFFAGEPELPTFIEEYTKTKEY